MRRSGAATAVLVLSAACGSANSGPASPAARASSLFAARVAYVGDNSRVVALVGQVGPAPAGSYTLRLSTTSPRAVRVDLRSSDKPFTNSDFREPATLLLGLIGNADQVTFAFGSDTFTLTAAGASSAVGFDVKRFGQDRQVLADYLTASSD